MLQHLRHILGACGARHQRHHGEIVETGKQEGQVHLEAVFSRMSIVHHMDLGQVEECLAGFAVCGHLAQRRGEGGAAAQRQARKHDPVRRPHQHHPAHGPTQGGKPGIGGGRHRGGIHIAGMGYDQGLGRGVVRVAAGHLGGGEITVHLSGQRRRVVGIKLSGHGGRAHGI